MSFEDVETERTPLWADVLVAVIEDDAASVGGFAIAGLSIAGGFRRTEVVDTAQWQVIDTTVLPS